MNFVEAKLLSVRVDELGHTASLEVVDKANKTFIIRLDNVKHLAVTEFRQQNVIEQLSRWTHERVDANLREAAFYLATGGPEEDCDSQLAAAAEKLIDGVSQGALEMLEISAIYGAQVLAAFTSMSVQPLSR